MKGSSEDDSMTSFRSGEWDMANGFYRLAGFRRVQWETKEDASQDHECLWGEQELFVNKNFPVIVPEEAGPRLRKTTKLLRSKYSRADKHETTLVY